MLLKYFYDPTLAHASYLVGCQRTGEAIVVDPGRDIDQYLVAARKEGVRITGVAETHIHADYVSGARELADRVNAKLFVSDEGPAEWKYQYAAQYQHQLLKNGDAFQVGNIRFEVLHTPGHTPESISFLVTDHGGGADQPMGIFTGDFVFVGSIGRPDLLEEAAGLMGTAEPGARDLFHSDQRFKSLPDFLQIWPAHGAGSACGKGLGAIPSSTVGYEKLFNPALQFTDEEEFVRYILSDQPEAPKYFAVMKRVNKVGPEIIGDRGLPTPQEVTAIPSAVESGTVIDLSPSSAYAQSHVPGTINIPTNMLAGWAGWILDYSKPAYLIADPSELPESMRVLHKIGIDGVAGYFDAGQVQQAGLRTESYPNVEPKKLLSKLESGQVHLIDVRSDEEWKAGRIPGAEHLFLGRLPDRLDDLDRTKPVVAHCRSGGRSAVAVSILQAAGFEAINLSGGYLAWLESRLPIEREMVEIASAGNGP